MPNRPVYLTQNNVSSISEEWLIIVTLLASYLQLTDIVLQVVHLAAKGGANTTDTVRYIMRTLVKACLGVQLNMNGAESHEKFGFAPTQLFKVVQGKQ